MRVAMIAATVALLVAGGSGPKKYAVTNDRALVVTREVLVKQGYDVVRVERGGPDIVVWYRAGNRGRGKGKGPPVRMVIHRPPHPRFHRIRDSRHDPARERAPRDQPGSGLPQFSRP